MGNLYTHRVAPRSKGDGLHVMVGNDLQDRSTVRCSSSVPSLARFPWDWPSVEITSFRSPGYEPLATTRRAETSELLRATETRLKTRRPPRPGNLGLNV